MKRVLRHLKWAKIHSAAVYRTTLDQLDNRRIVHGAHQLMITTILRVVISGSRIRHFNLLVFC